MSQEGKEERKLNNKLPEKVPLSLRMLQKKGERRGQAETTFHNVSEATGALAPVFG